MISSLPVSLKINKHIFNIIYKIQNVLNPYLVHWSFFILLPDGAGPQSGSASMCGFLTSCGKVSQES